MRSSNALLRFIAKAVVNAAAGGLPVGDFLVDVLPEIAQDAYDAWIRWRSEEEQRSDIEELVLVADSGASRLAAECVAKVAADQPEAVRQLVTDYLTMVPAAIRISLKQQELTMLPALAYPSLRQQSDSSGMTILPDAVPRSAADLTRLLPPTQIVSSTIPPARILEIAQDSYDEWIRGQSEEEQRSDIEDSDLIPDGGSLRLATQLAAAIPPAQVNYYLQLKDKPKTALADYDQAIQINPNDAFAYIDRGLYSKANGDLDGAIADYDHALHIDPKYALAFRCRGDARVAEGDLDGAIADFDKAIQIDPNDALAFRYRGIARQGKGDLDGAIADFDKAIQIDSKYVFAYCCRGVARYAKGDLDGAVADYDQAIQIDPRYALAFRCRGNAREAKGDLDGAVADYDQAIQVDSKYVLAYIKRGLVREVNGDFDGAIAEYNQAIHIDPNDPFVYIKRGQVRQAQHDKEGASADFAKASRLASNDPS